MHLEESGSQQSFDVIDALLVVKTPRSHHSFDVIIHMTLFLLYRINRRIYYIVSFLQT